MIDDILPARHASPLQIEMSAPGVFRPPPAVNEPVRSHAPGTPERTSLQARLAEMASSQVEMPLMIGGDEVRTGRTFQAAMPHRRAHVLGTVHWAGPGEAERAIQAAAAAWPGGS